MRTQDKPQERLRWQSNSVQAVPRIHKLSNDDIEYLSIDSQATAAHGFTMQIGGRAVTAEINNAIKFVRAARAAELEAVVFDHFDETIE